MPAKRPGRCPSYRITDDEKHSTHHRAVTLKAALDGKYGAHPFLSTELSEAMELCVSCKGCKSECPHGVDMALLRVEALAQRWQQLGRVPLRECLFANMPRFAMHLKLVNWVGALRKRVPLLARAMERWFDIAARRSPPKATVRDFISSQALSVAATEGACEVVRGWSFDADGREGAALKGWVESRFGLLPRHHGASIRYLSSKAYRRYLEMRATALYGTNALESQFDLLYTYCHTNSPNRIPAKLTSPCIAA